MQKTLQNPVLVAFISQPDIIVSREDLNSTDEVREDIEFLRNLMADPVRFKTWANDLLDRAHKVNV